MEAYLSRHVAFKDPQFLIREYVAKSKGAFAPENYDDEYDDSFDDFVRYDIAKGTTADESDKTATGAFLFVISCPCFLNAFFIVRPMSLSCCVL